jgi:hypothetical protein
MDQRLGDLYEPPGAMNTQWLQHMTKSLDEEFFSSLLQQRPRGRAEAPSQKRAFCKSSAHKDQLLLYNRFLHDYLLTQVRSLIDSSYA